MASVSIRPVRSRRELKRFIELPFRLHRDHPQWVPPLKLERRLFLSRRMNAFFSHGEAEYFLAQRDGRVVGRITRPGQPRLQRLPAARTGDGSGSSSSRTTRRCSTALLDAAAAWLRERGKERMVGPASFAMNDESGDPDRGLRAARR